ncbi:MAG: ABC transporter substrate-binding protein, partial [candidate division NC10 bacterium]|nr:ABC transporter substrate-binding protein [candidate division NC10 bacterium]
MNRVIRVLIPGLLSGLLLIPGAPPSALAASTFVWGAQGEPVCLDPAIITDGISGMVTNQIFEGLVKYEGATTEVVPALAERWQVSPDGTAWTFTLRKNAKFHDGTPFDAKAVVWNFERWRFTKHPQHENQVKAGQTFEYYE